MLVSGGEKSATRKSTNDPVVEPARSVSNPAVPLIEPQSPDQPENTVISHRKKAEAAQPRANVSKPSKTLELSQEIGCLTDNPKMKGKDPYNRYEKYKFATKDSSLLTLSS